MAGGAVLGISLTCAIFPPRGLRSTPRSLPSARKKQKQYTRKARSMKVTATLELEPPPYPLDALEPYMSKETLEYHWGQHHKEYVENLNTQIAGTEMDTKPLREILTVSYEKGDLPTYKKAAQVWNHDFFWKSMKPGGGGKPSGVLLQQIEKDFGSFEGFVEKFKSASATQFGSGWAWLAYKANRLRIGVTIYPPQEEPKLVVVKSAETINPLVWDYYPILAIDVWEHAYYIDFENRREDYTSMFLEKLVSWEEVSSRFEIAKGEASEREEYDKPRELIGLRLERLERERRKRRRQLIRKAIKRRQARSSK